MTITVKAAHFRGQSRAVEALANVGLLGAMAFVLARLPLSWSAVALGGSTLTLTALVMPAVGLAALGFAIPFSDFLPLPIPLVEAVDLLVGLVAVGWLARGVLRRRIVFHRPPLTAILAIFLWSTALSLTQAGSWREGLPEWLKWLEFAAVYLIGCQLLTQRSARWIVAALLAAGVIQALIGAYQFTRQVGPEAFVLMGRFMRAYGTFGQPNPYAGYLGYLFPVAASLALGSLGLWWHSRTPRAAIAVGMYGASAALLGLGILMSWSRGAWLGVAASLVILLGFRSRRAAALTVVAVLLAALLVTATGTAGLPGFIGERLTDLGGYFTGPDPARTEITDANFSVLERLAHWQAGWRMFEDHPWLGVGIGNYAVAYAGYQLPHWYEPLGHAHNVFINFLAETGVLGGGSFLVLWLALPFGIWRRMTYSQSGEAGTWAHALCIGVVAAWAYITVHSLFDNLFVQHIQLQLALMLCAVIAATGRAMTDEGTV